jgi:hypothetical protein
MRTGKGKLSKLVKPGDIVRTQALIVAKHLPSQGLADQRHFSPNNKLIQAVNNQAGRFGLILVERQVSLYHRFSFLSVGVNKRLPSFLRGGFESLLPLVFQFW